MTTTTKTDNAPARRDDVEVSPAVRLHDAIEKVGPELSRLGVDGDRLARILWTEARNTPALLKCDPASFVAAALQTAQLGLEPGHGEVWLIPRKIGGRLVVTWQLGYRGLISLAADDGIMIQAETVYEGDHYRETKGTSPRIEHTAAVRGPDDDPKPVCWYATATLPDGRVFHRVLSLAEIKHRVGSAYTKSDAWRDHHNAMCMVTAIRSLKTFLPLSPRTRAADAASDNDLQAPDGVRSVSRDMVSVLSVERDDVDDVDDGASVPVEEPEDPADEGPDAEATDTAEVDPSDDAGQLDEALVLNLQEWRHAADLDDEKKWKAWIAGHCDGAAGIDDLDEDQARALLAATKARAEHEGDD